MKSNTTEIALIPGASLTPPPKKSELIEALAIRELAYLTELKKTQDEAIAKAMAEFEASAEEDIKATAVPTGDLGHYHPYNKGTKDTSRVESLHRTISTAPSHKTQQLWTKVYKIKSAPDRIGWLPDLKVVRDRIRQRLLEGGTASERVAKLLKDPKTSKALDGILEKLRK